MVRGLDAKKDGFVENEADEDNDNGREDEEEEDDDSEVDPRFPTAPCKSMCFQ